MANKKHLSKVLSVLLSLAMLTSTASAAGIGVATHMSQGRDVDATLSAAKQVKATWVRDEIKWDQVETSKGNLSIPDRAAWVTEAKAAGMNTLAILGYGNPVAYNAAGNVPTVSDDGSTGWWDSGMPVKDGNAETTKDDEYFDAYINYVDFVSKNLGDKIDAYEIWNEPDHRPFNGNQVSGTDYAKLLKAARDVIKTNDPEATVLGGSFAHPNGGFCTQDETNLQNFMSDMLTEMGKSTNGAKDYMDAVAFHSYSWGSQPEDFLKANVDNMKKNFPNMDLWLTETGWTVSGDYATEEEQAKWTIRNAVLFDEYLRESGLSGQYIDYELQNTTGSTDGENNFGAFNSDYSPKTAAKSISVFNKVIADKGIDSLSVTEEGNIITGEWNKYFAKYSNAAGDTAYVAWTDDADETSTVEVTLPAGAIIYNYDGTVRETVSAAGSKTISISDAPTIIDCAPVADTEQVNMIIEPVISASASQVTVKFSEYITGRYEESGVWTDMPINGEGIEMDALFTVVGAEIASATGTGSEVTLTFKTPLTPGKYSIALADEYKDLIVGSVTNRKIAPTTFDVVNPIDLECTSDKVKWVNAGIAENDNQAAETTSGKKGDLHNIGRGDRLVTETFLKVEAGDTIRTTDNTYEYILYGYTSPSEDGYKSHIDTKPGDNAASNWSNYDYTFPTSLNYGTEGNGEAVQYPIYVRILMRNKTTTTAAVNPDSAKGLFEFNVAADKYVDADEYYGTSGLLWKNAGGNDSENLGRITPNANRVASQKYIKLEKGDTIYSTDPDNYWIWMYGYSEPSLKGYKTKAVLSQWTGSYTSDGTYPYVKVFIRSAANTAIDPAEASSKIKFNLKSDYTSDNLVWANQSVNDNTGVLAGNVSRLATTGFLKVEPGDVIKLNDIAYEFILYGYSSPSTDGFVGYIDTNGAATSGNWAQTYTFANTAQYGPIKDSNGAILVAEGEKACPEYVRIVARNKNNTSKVLNIDEAEGVFEYKLSSSKHLPEKDYSFENVSWKNAQGGADFGRIDGNGTILLVSKSYVKVEPGMTITSTDPNYKVYMFGYSAPSIDGLIKANITDGWASSYTFDETYSYVRIFVKNVNSAEITPAEVEGKLQYGIFKSVLDFNIYKVEDSVETKVTEDIVLNGDKLKAVAKMTNPQSEGIQLFFAEYGSNGRLLSVQTADSSLENVNLELSIDKLNADTKTVKAFLWEKDTIAPIKDVISKTVKEATLTDVLVWKAGQTIDDNGGYLKDNGARIATESFIKVNAGDRITLNNTEDSNYDFILYGYSADGYKNYIDAKPGDSGASNWGTDFTFPETLNYGKEGAGEIVQYPIYVRIVARNASATTSAVDVNTVKNMFTFDVNTANGHLIGDPYEFAPLFLTWTNAKFNDNTGEIINDTCVATTSFIKVNAGDKIMLTNPEGSDCGFLLYAYDQNGEYQGYIDSYPEMTEDGDIKWYENWGTDFAFPETVNYEGGPQAGKAVQYPIYVKINIKERTTGVALNVDTVKNMFSFDIKTLQDK